MNFRARFLTVASILIPFLLMNESVGEVVAVSSQLTIDRIFSGDEFETKNYAIQWMPDGSYSRLEKSNVDENKGDENEGGEKKVDGQIVDDNKELEAESNDELLGRDLVRYDAGSGDRSVLVKEAEFIPAEGEKPLDVEDYSWSGDLSKLLIYTNSRKVWRVNSRGDYWVLDRNTGTLKKLGQQFPESTLMFAKFSPDASRVAYVQNSDIWLEAISTGEVRRLTTKESDNIINGTFDWVYEEEFGIRDGFQWSPDGNRIAFWQLDTSNVPRFTMIDNTTNRYPTLKTFAYPKAGETNSVCRIGVLDLQTGATRLFSFPGDARENYIPRIDWSDDSQTVVVQRLNRLQNQLTIWMVVATTGNARSVFEDRDSAWVDVDEDFHWTHGESSFVWSSERDGWNRLYEVSRDGSRITAVTPPNVDVTDLLAFDPATGNAWYLASPDEPQSRYLYRTSLDQQTAVRLTPADQSGMHSYDISPDYRFAVHRYSRMNEPTVVELIRLSDHSVTRVLEDNAELRQKLKSAKLGDSRFISVNVDDGNGKLIRLDGWQILPPDFDASQKHPTLFYIYSEPAGQTVLDRWGGSKYLWHQMLAQRGYIVMSFDSRGTPAPRGTKWRKSIYRRMGQIAVEDQANAVRASAKKFPFIDAERVGIWGWSGGGTMSLHAIFRHPETYKMAIAIAPVPELSYYDTIYQERYMGLPKDNAEGYKLGSAINHAEKLQGKLLLVHGTGDDNCHYQTTELLINKLIRLKKQFSMFSYPNRSHSIKEGENTTVHLRQMMTDFVLDNL